MKTVALKPWDKRLFIQHMATKTQIVFANTNDFEKLQEEIIAIVSAGEIDRSEKFFQIKDKQKYLLGKYVLRTVLAAATGSSAKEICFTTHANKKPSFKLFEFNITHAESHVYIAFCPVAIGIDCEEINANFDYNAILDRCFSNDEKHLFQHDKKVENFYTAWTRKEALLKATGEGISDDMKEVVVINEEVTRHGNKFFLTSLRHDNYAISFATLGKVAPEIWWRFSHQ